MKIYTRKGDQGETGLLGGTRVPKHHDRIEAYGTLDELNSFIGWLNDEIDDAEINGELLQIQQEVFTVGSHLAADPNQTAFELPALDTGLVEQLEKRMDAWDQDLSPLKNFILPGGHPSVSQCHVCRTITRRAERRINALGLQTTEMEHILRFVNRLSDYFFVLARWLSKANQAEEVVWKPRG